MLPLGMIFRWVPWIIAINVAVFLAWGYAPWYEYMGENFTVSFDGLVEGRYWTLVTSVFSHNLLFHILINMFVLQSFGGVVEQVLGGRRFITFYLCAGIVSSLSHCLVSAFVIGEPQVPAVGASGAIAGLILLFALIFPREKILIFGIIPMPAIFGSFAFIALDLWGLYAQAGGGGLPIGHGAHLGGAFAGILYYFFALRGRIRHRGAG